MVTAVVDGPGAVCLHQNRVVRIGNQIVIFPGSGMDADVRHADDRQAVPAFGAHRAVRSFFADRRSRFAIAQVAGKQPVGDNRRTLRGHAFIVVRKRAKAGAVLKASVGDNIHNLGAVLQLPQFFGGEETHARKIRFHAQHAVELNRMADRFVNLQAQLRAIENDRALPLGALGGRMQRNRFFGDALRMGHQVERFDQFVAAQHVLSAKTVRIRALLDFVSGEGRGHDSRRPIAFSPDESRSRCSKQKAARFAGRSWNLRRP